MTLYCQGRLLKVKNPPKRRGSQRRRPVWKRRSWRDHEGRWPCRHKPRYVPRRRTTGEIGEGWPCYRHPQSTRRMQTNGVNPSCVPHRGNGRKGWDIATVFSLCEVHYAGCSWGKLWWRLDCCLSSLKLGQLKRGRWCYHAGPKRGMIHSHRTTRVPQETSMLLHTSFIIFLLSPLIF
jgi:hypothetical protein